MTKQTHNLLISLASHMAYMQGQLEAFTQQSDPEDFYWYRESVTLRQKVIDALAEGDGPAVPEGGEPVSITGEPSDEEVMELMPQQMHEDLSAAARAMAEQTGVDSVRVKGLMRIILNRHSVDHARAVLARWGRPAPVQAVEALAARPLLEQVAAIGDCISEQTVGQVRALADRAAAWLAENPPGQPVAIEPRGCPTPGACSCVELPGPVPVALSERPWEREGWCDDEGRCWAFNESLPAWEFLSCTASRKWADLFLPFDALPLPQ